MILLSFLAVIIVGTLLLMLPISSADGTPQPFVTALFTATTATCVTGLVVVPTVAAWSTFGQVVILLLIQIGGLGLITILAGLSLFLHRKMKLSDSLLLQDAFNLTSLSGLGSFVKKVLLGTLIAEGIGALLYMTVFVPAYHWKGVWISVFASVSAFCNAGMDVLASNSLCDYVDHPMINAVTSTLIIVGGLGFIVWWDLLRVVRERKTHKGHPLKRLTLHSKIVLSSTLTLLVVGAILFFTFEYNNPATIGELSLFGKIQAAFFQSVTTRTAGFASVPQENLTNASAFLSLILMFIGGSPVGTAGGIKTVTFTVLLATALAAVRNRRDVSLFGRTVPKEMIRKAVGVCCMSFAILFLSTLLLSVVTDASALDILYETASATATVGLSRNLTATLTAAGKFIIIVTMYLGRVGPISLAVALNFKKESRNIIKDPEESISVG
jgi:trk system potassium uptake protein TrkH